MPKNGGVNSVKSLLMPSQDMSGKILRKVNWDQSLSGSIYAAGHGSVPAEIFSIEELYDLLSGLPDFTVDFRQVQQWVGEVLGDTEVASGIGDALGGSSEDQIRAVISDLLGERIAQCRAVLEVAEEVRQGRNPERPA